MSDNTPPPYSDPPAAVPPYDSAAATINAPVVEKRGNGVGLAALIVGAAALLFAIIPLISFVAWFPALVAIVLGIVGLVLKGRRRLLAGLGLGLGAVALIVAIIVSIATVAGVAGAVRDAATSQPLPTATTPADAAPTVAASGAAPVAPDTEFPVTIVSGTQSSDYAGKPALVVTYTFTNNSAKDANFLTTLSAKAFQNGVELDTGIVTDADTTSTLSDIKPGATTSVQEAYLLTDSSPVTIEVKKLFDFSDAIVATTTITLQ